MSRWLYYYETSLGENKITHPAKIASETEKTYVVKTQGLEMTVRKSKMTHSEIGGTFYFFETLEACEKAHQAYLKKTAEWCETQAKRLLDEAKKCRDYIWPDKEKKE